MMFSIRENTLRASRPCRTASPPQRAPFSFSLDANAASLPSCYCCPRASLLRRCHTRLFVKASGRLGGPIRFEFYRDSPHVRRPISSHSAFLCGPPMTVEGDVVHLERPWSDTADPVRSYASWFYHDDSTAEAHPRSRLRRVRFRWTRRHIWRDFRIR